MFNSAHLNNSLLAKLKKEYCSPATIIEFIGWKQLVEKYPIILKKIQFL